MRFYIYSKVLGPYLPTNKVNIGGCTFEKQKCLHFLEPEDRAKIPVVDESMATHNLQHGVHNFVQYPQMPVSSRNFQSEYSLHTEVDARDLRDAVRVATERFDFVTANLSLVVRTKVRKIGNRRVRRGDENYDYEIIGAFIKTKGQYMRVKMPEPLVNVHNYFPASIPRGFLSTTKRLMDNQDRIFYKALMYIQEATKMKDTGNYHNVLRILCLIKCIELISKSLNTPLKKWNVAKTKKVDITTKGLFELAGKKIRVTEKSIKVAQQAWEARNNADVAHASEHREIAWINHSTLDAVANEYLLKYKKYMMSNPPQVITFGGRGGWRA